MAIWVETMKVSHQLGRWLRRLRRSRGLSQEEVAYSAEIDVKTYSRLERGGDREHSSNPTLDTMIRVMKVLGADTDDFRALVELSKAPAARPHEWSN